jgi:hypothetical protein
MESLARLVTQSLARNNFSTTLDYRRLQWSRWSRCESSISVLLAPSQAGIFALAEEIISPVLGGKRMLAVFQVTEAKDLGMTLGRLFLPGSPLQERLTTGHCFARYAVIEDAQQRQSAYTALRDWMTANAETATGIAEFPAESPSPLPAGF